MSSCPILARGSGPWVRQDPGVPRALGCFKGATRLAPPKPQGEGGIKPRARMRRENAAACSDTLPRRGGWTPPSFLPDPGEQDLVVGTLPDLDLLRHAPGERLLVQGDV